MDPRIAELNASTRGLGGSRDATCRLGEGRVSRSEGWQCARFAACSTAGGTRRSSQPTFLRRSSGSREHFTRACRRKTSSRSYERVSISIPRRSLPEELDLRVLVASPRRRKLGRGLQSQRRKLGVRRGGAAELEGRDGAYPMPPFGSRTKSRCTAKSTQRSSGSEARKRVPFTQLDSGEALDALPEGERFILDVASLVASRAETRPHVVGGRADAG